MTTNGESTVSNPELAAEAILTNLANKRASADPLPGPAGEAFTSGPIMVGGVTVHKVVPRHFQALKAIGSPLIEMMQDVVSSGKVDTEFTDEQAWEICWIFTHTGKEVRECLSKGAMALQEAAQIEIGDKEFPVNLVIIAIMEQLKRHMATATKQTIEAKEDGQISFFRDSAAPQPEAMAG